MDLKASSSNSGDLSPSEEHEFSDDDDRNHKHRRREADAHTQSLNKDINMDQVFSRPFRKRNNSYENGHSYKANDFQLSEGSSRFERRCPGPGFSSFPRPPLDINQRIRAPQIFLGDHGHVIGTVSDPWSQVGHQGSFPPSLFSNSQNPSWNPFGMMPRVPNGGLDPFHLLGLQGSMRPPMNPSLNIGMPLQRCRDFEERGFCLRGDMCPMEHGINRIVIEDFQSLSQFNLPAPLPSSHLLGAPIGPISTPSLTAPSSTFMNNKVLQSKIVKPDTLDNELGLSSSFLAPNGAGGPDLYDPDQPLWNNDRPQPFEMGLSLNASKNDESKNSIWNRVGGSGLKEESDSNICLPDQLIDDIKKDQEGGIDLKNTNSSNKTQSGYLRNNITRKPSQKALRTLFVNCIPQTSNKREALLLHFKKYGEVIDIHIPLNSEQAFVQFLKREEAEAALRAPDAVMGNRFIKLYWANRDRIVDDGMGSGNNMYVSPIGTMKASTIRSHAPVVSHGKYKLQSGPSMPSVPVPPTADLLKPVKKLDNLELLKEEIRKKQEMLDKKRNDFKLKLQKLEKQNSLGPINEEESIEPSAKRHKAETITSTSKPSDPGTSRASPLIIEKKKSVDIAVSPSLKVTPAKILNQPTRPLMTPSPMNRFKLDNRPTSFRIVPPLPAGLADVTILKEHFSSYGDCKVELEDQEENNTSSKTSKNYSTAARITFTSRPFAENAFKNGKSWQGTNLQFTWLTSINSRPKNENSVSAPKESSSENGNCRGVDHIESDKDLRSSLIEILHDSPKRDGIISDF